jgi:hypothetical protein
MASRLASLHAAARARGVLADDVQAGDMQVLVGEITGAVGAGVPVSRVVDLILRGVIVDPRA